MLEWDFHGSPTVLCGAPKPLVHRHIWLAEGWILSAIISEFPAFAAVFVVPWIGIPTSCCQTSETWTELWTAAVPRFAAVTRALSSNLATAKRSLKSSVSSTTPSDYFMVTFYPCPSLYCLIAVGHCTQPRMNKFDKLSSSYNWQGVSVTLSRLAWFSPGFDPSKVRAASPVQIGQT